MYLADCLIGRSYLGCNSEEKCSCVNMSVNIKDTSENEWMRPGQGGIFEEWHAESFSVVQSSVMVPVSASTLTKSVPKVIY